jgi:hypothetical protein
MAAIQGLNQKLEDQLKARMRTSSFAEADGPVETSPLSLHGKSRVNRAFATQPPRVAAAYARS